MNLWLSKLLHHDILTLHPIGNEPDYQPVDVHVSPNISIDLALAK